MTFISRSRYWLPIAPMLGLLAMSYWLNQQAQPGQSKQDSGVRHAPDAVMENFSALNLNEQGTPRFIMAAKKFQHFPDNDSTLLEVPRFVMLSEAQPAIHIIAQQGIIATKANEVFLHKDVEILREASSAQEELTLHTEYLHLIPDKDWADTDQAVILSDAHQTVNAVGLEMNNKERTLKLLSHVRSVYAPTHQ